MMIGKNLSCALAALCVSIAAGAAYADAGTVGEGLDACLAAAMKERPGFLHGWKDVSGGSYVISIVNAEGKIADAVCNSAAPSNFQFKDRFGLRMTGTYERITVPEVSARSTAPQLFAGPVRIVEMSVDFKLSGQPAYEYRLVLPNGREAMAQVDTLSGILLHAEVLGL